ncbi:hypothetical protein EVAR_39422_1 [Eumeta japonica]|uniref:Uncharacterized protein n=1 Tax=Eumeta variegata TaxID=151549 RepID=A0A4C1Z023_EUMVA|nr:hypothetical protein EVAR_39422_1 [Eumeta japonica]
MHVVATCRAAASVFVGTFRHCAQVSNAYSVRLPPLRYNLATLRVCCECQFGYGGQFPHSSHIPTMDSHSIRYSAYPRAGNELMTHLGLRVFMGSDDYQFFGGLQARLL